MTRTRNTYLVLLAVLLLPITANADLIILDEDNGYLAALEPGVLLEQPDFENTFNFITGTNLEFGIGGVFSGQTTIGNGLWLGGYKPKELADQGIEFMIRTNSGAVYTAYLTYFVSWGSGAHGTHPGSGSNVGAAFDITRVPEPGTLALFGIGLLGMGAARRRKKA